MDIAEIQASPREANGSRACGRLRRQGLVPAVLYGHGDSNVDLSLSRDEIEGLIQSHTSVLQVAWDGQSDAAQVREVQYDALGDRIMHVDFMRISLTETITVSVPVEVHGEAVGLAAGGVQELRLHEIEVECLPGNIPADIEVSVLELGIGDEEP